MSNQMTGRQVEKSDQQRFGRRFRFSMSVLVAQLLLLGAGIGWCFHMAMILKYGEVYFVEPNSLILYAEIVATALIVVYAAIVFALQWKRLGERRRSDR